MGVSLKRFLCHLTLNYYLLIRDYIVELIKNYNPHTPTAIGFYSIKKKAGPEGPTLQPTDQLHFTVCNKRSRPQ